MAGQFHKTVFDFFCSRTYWVHKTVQVYCDVVIRRGIKNIDVCGCSIAIIAGGFASLRFIQCRVTDR